MKKLLILGGVLQMVDIVRIARELGVYTIVADRVKDSPGKQVADMAVDISTDQVDELEALCRRENVTGIFTGFEDFNIHIACELCRRLDLPFYATPEQLDMITNKVRFKEMCRKHGIPVVEEYATIEEAVAQQQYPYIVKPADSYGSRGITICRDESTLRKGCRDAAEASTTGRIIIERFVESDIGPEVFYNIIDGHIHLTATCDRHTKAQPGESVPLPLAELFPSRFEAELVAELDEKIRAMFRDMGLQNGPALIQMLYDNGRFVVYEMAFRLTGEQWYRMLERQQGFNQARMMVKLALGESVSEYDTSVLDLESFCYPCVNLIYPLKAGTIATVRGIEEVNALEEVVSCNQVHFEGDVIGGKVNYGHMLTRVNVVAPTYSRLCEAVRTMHESISVISDRGEEMVIGRFEMPPR